MRNSALLALEILWIVIGLLCIFAGIRYTITNGGNRIFLFIVMALISFAFAYWRHKQRKKN
jgi:hypothetical protein